MGLPYLLDLRKRAVASVESGMSRREAAKLYQVSYSAVIIWVKRAKQTGSPAALPIGGKKPFKLTEESDWILRRLVERPDMTGRALLAELHDREIDVNYYAVWNFLDRAGLSYKKTLRAAEQDRPDVARRRAQWQGLQGKVDAQRIIFIDETWAKTNMTRLHGRCPIGQRLLAKVPHGHSKTLTFVAGLRCDGIVAPCVFNRPINAKSFLAWVIQFLVPTLRPGNIVVMDNLSSHKSSAVRRAIRDTGAKLFFLPPYSPDLNPIEQAFAKLKTLLRKENARTIEQTTNCIGKLIDQITPNECVKYFRKAGYST